jgi:hypothetical protein
MPPPSSHSRTVIGTHTTSRRACRHAWHRRDGLVTRAPGRDPSLPCRASPAPRIQTASLQEHPLVSTSPFGHWRRSPCTDWWPWPCCG